VPAQNPLSSSYLSLGDLNFTHLGHFWKARTGHFWQAPKDHGHSYGAGGILIPLVLAICVHDLFDEPGRGQYGFWSRC
jgi:hypothetical protein